MRWNSSLSRGLRWSKPISNLEAKHEVAQKLAAEVRDGDVIGFGSGSTSFVAIQAIAERVEKERIACTAIPTSAEIELTCVGFGIRTVSLVDACPDWAFDGADEVDPDHNLIKGRGGAMFREKLLIDSSPRTFILVDQSKMVSKLGQKFPIPVEIFPFAISFVFQKLSEIGATDLELRSGSGKDGPVITENGNLIADVRFRDVQRGLEREIKAIPGVIETGLFQGRKLEVLVSRQ